MIPFVSKKWELRRRAIGSDLGNNCFQFRFDFEEDMKKVVTSANQTTEFWKLCRATPRECRPTPAIGIDFQFNLRYPVFAEFGGEVAIGDIRVVQQFEDVFQLLKGLPPSRSDPFMIEQEPGTASISKMP
ncbi:unnamed protein product [Microthlaspi erraticum]|uniref:DUF4283 domain-containing protein n=1 Tax=Microthlaspi erraticum TaxID=1685480 RepID=A0A6D2IU26_9BRAS|nr:unnamed protein product [Microthlaspi erraticum]